MQLSESPARIPFGLAYRSGMDCPGCGKSHWYVGRITAQCAFCAFVIPTASRS